MEEESVSIARRRVAKLEESLKASLVNDSEQEVQGIGIHVLDSVLRSVRDVLSKDPVVKTMTDVISPDRVINGEIVRAADALHLVGQLAAALGAEPGWGSASYVRSLPPF